MATTPNSPAAPPAGPKTNRIGLTVLDYRGGKSTLCAGCGHNAISERIIDAFYEMGIEPEHVVKMSAASAARPRAPRTFMSRSHSFNSVHGRMPSVTTGAVLANSKMLYIGVSGDGDTASIGMGQFVHLMRRNLPMIYIIEDNGVYGLTKGQFSATADVGSKLKTGTINDLPPIDTCALADRCWAQRLSARSFSGDKKQLHTMLKAAIAHNGTVMLDVISPCTTFNDHEGSTKIVQVHEGPRGAAARHELRAALRRDRRGIRRRQRHVIDARRLEAAAAQAGRRVQSHQPAGGHQAAMPRRARRGEVLTGLFYVHTTRPASLDLLNMVDQPLATLPQAVTRPSREALEECMEELR
jgi:2-oxoglutarate/2-oxoacid ferredoxin oxidoreductase subunit beta